MDLRQLRYFVTVAEELNFSRAAEKLHMSQPPLSQHIKALEDELGVALLFRTRREVKLTGAGRVFLKEARDVMEHLKVGVKNTVRAASGDLGVLRLGMSTSAAFNVMPTILDKIRLEFPLVDIVVTDMESKEQIRLLAQDKLDIGFIHAAPEVRGMHSVSLFSEPYAVVIPSGHPLTLKEPLSMADLAGVPLIAFSREHAPALSDALIATCLRAGFSPTIAHTARHPLTILQMVVMGLGVALVPQSFARTTFGGAIFRNLSDESGHVHIDAIWLANNPSELVQRVVREILTPGLS